MISRSRTAVVVVSYGSSQLLRHNLAAVAAERSDLVVVVVDSYTDQSERDTVTALCAEHDWLLVAPDHNTGYGGGNNLGVAAAIEAGADTILILNPDARIDGASLARLEAVVEGDPMTLAAPVIRTESGQIWSDGTDLYLDRGRMRATRKRADDVTESEVLPWLTGAVLLTSRELWEAVGGIDDDYFLYWEDVDFSRRCVDAGGRLTVVRGAEAVHDEGATQAESGGGRTRSNIYYYYNIRNRLVFAAKHLDAETRRRWVRTSVAEAYAIVLRGGRRQLLASTGPWKAAIAGTIDGLTQYWRLTQQHRRRHPLAEPGPLRVLQSFPEPRPTTNPYIVMLRDALAAQPDVTLDTWSWRRALTESYDVFHAHWPEILVSGANPLNKTTRQLLFVAFLIRLRARRTGVVRTRHNLELPQGISRRETLLLTLFDRATTLDIVLNESTPDRGRPSTTILHGHYRGWFDDFPRAEKQSGRFAYVGLIRRYKAVDTLIAAFTELASTRPDVSLSVGGRPSTSMLSDELISLAGDDPRIGLRLEFLSDAELVDAVTASEVVVLPYREMHNSGSVLAALSLDRPVLVPDNEVNQKLAREVGDGWIRTYDELTAAVLDHCQSADAPATDQPDLSARDWSGAADQHLQAYRRAWALAKGPGSVSP